MKKWLHSSAGIVSIILLIVSFLLLLSTKVTIGTDDPLFYSNVLIGFATNLCGIVITISFVQYFIDKQDAIEERSEEIKKIKRYDRYMQTLIQRYQMFLMSVTIKIENRNEANIDNILDSQFKFSDMADMYQTSLYVGESFGDSSIELFYRAEENLRDYMLKMLENIDFKYTSILENILMKFVTESAVWNVQGRILEAPKRTLGDKGKLSQVVSNWIADEKEDWLGQFEKGKLKSGHVMYPYVCLYMCIQDQKKLIKEYRNYISKLDA